MNTAVLTGRQVSQAMKVFIVSQGGKIADVTLQSSCQAEDESVIKVRAFIYMSNENYLLLICVSRFHHHVVLFMLTALKQEVHQMHQLLSNMERMWVWQSLLFGCQNFHLKFQLPIFDYLKLKDGKYQMISMRQLKIL